MQDSSWCQPDYRWIRPRRHGKKRYDKTYRCVEIDTIYQGIIQNGLKNHLEIWVLGSIGSALVWLHNQSRKRSAPPLHVFHFFIVGQISRLFPLLWSSVFVTLVAKKSIYEIRAWYGVWYPLKLWGRTWLYVIYANSSSVRNSYRFVHSFFKVLKYRSIGALSYGHPALLILCVTWTDSQYSTNAFDVYCAPCYHQCFVFKESCFNHLLFLLLLSSYYKVVVFIDPLQGLYAILLEILWIVFLLLPLDGFWKATTTVSLYIC